MRAGPIILGLAFLLSIQQPHTGERGTHSARLGDLQVTVTAIRTASEQDLQQYRLSPGRTGYKFILVFVTLRDIAKFKNCTFPDFSLRVNQGFEYGVYNGGLLLMHPQTTDLLPTDESSGELAFQIKAGTEPAVLKVVRTGIVDDFCAEAEHRETKTVGPDAVNLSLVGLPSDTTKP